MSQESETDKKAEVRFIAEVVDIDGEAATLQVYPQYRDGLKDIGSYSHLIVLYWAHLRDNEIERQTILVFPRRHGRKVKTGVFACRSPSRPNPICLCVVELLEVEGCNLKVKGLDAELRSPIVDIKPYHPHSDSIPNAKFPEWVLNRTRGQTNICARHESKDKLTGYHGMNYFVCSGRRVRGLYPKALKRVHIVR